MAVRPEIALQGRPIDLGSTFNNILSNIGRLQDIRQQQAIAPLQQQQAQLDLQNQQLQSLQSREKARFQSLYQGALELQPAITEAAKTGDWSSVKNSLISRRERLVGQQQQGLPVDTTETDEALAMLDQNPNALVQAVDQSIKLGGALFGNARGKTDFERKMEIISSPTATDEEKKAARIALDLEAGAKEFKTIDIAGVPFTFNPVTGEFKGVSVNGKEITASSVAEAKAKIKKAEEIAGAEGKQTVEEIGVTAKELKGIDKAMSMTQRVIKLVNEGASTGKIQNLSPSFKAATIELHQLLGEEILNRISTVSLGAISEGEIELLRRVAIPTDMQPEALKDYMRRRSIALEKARKVAIDKINFLNEGGTLAEFIQSREAQMQQNQSQEDPLGIL